MLNSRWERGVSIYERNSPADPKVSARGGAGGAPGSRAEIPLQPIVRQLCPCSPWRLKGEQRFTCSPRRIHARAGGGLKEAVTPWEAHAGAGSWQDL